MCSPAAQQIEGGHCRRFKMSATLACLSDIRRFIDDVADESHLDEERAYDLKVAVSEACANAVEHSKATADLLEICAWVYGDRIVVEIRDTGDFRLPPAGANNTRPYRGLGLPLMVALMDEVRIGRMPEGGTMVSLSLYLSPQKRAQRA